VIAALSLSGLPIDRFIFEGFLPVKHRARCNRLKEIAKEKRTVVFYESPHRILKALADIKDELGDPVVICARELTKKFEELKEQKASVLIEHFSRHKPKGEFVLILNLKNCL